MVVADDEVNAEGARLFHPLDGFYAAVERDDEGVAPLMGVLDTLARDTVTLIETVGDVEAEAVGGRRHAAEGLVDKGDGRDPVDVIIAVDEDALAVIERALDPVHRAVHVAHEERVMQGTKIRVEEIVCRLGRIDASLNQEARDDWGYANL